MEDSEVRIALNSLSISYMITRLSVYRSEAIEYNGDLLTPPDVAKKQKQNYIANNKTIRSSNYSDDDDDLD